MLTGEVPSPINPPKGCNFCTRCKYATERCRTEEPILKDVGGTIMMEATLNFLGFGVNINTPSWGYILTSQGRSKMYTAPWIGLAPGLAITIMVFAAAMFGDGVRDILDPRLKGGMGSFSLKKIRRIADKYVASRKNSEVA